jgi:serine/threonine-protein kinase RsbW
MSCVYFGHRYESQAPGKGRNAVIMSGGQDRDPIHGSHAVTEDFTVGDLHRVRGLVDEASVAAGLPSVSASNLIVAVNEILINAVIHAGGGGSVTVETSQDGVRIEVRDSGPGVPVDVPTERPGPHVEGGRGLWMARKLCPHFSITNGPAGAIVRLFMPVRALAGP